MAGGSGLSTGGGDSAPDSFLSMVALIGNPTALAAEYAKLQAAKQEAQTMVELVGPANSIRALYDEAAALRDRAEADTAQADAEASATVAKGEAQARSLLDAASASATAMALAARAALDEAKSSAQQATDSRLVAFAAVQAVREREAACDTREAALNAREADLETRESTISERTAQLDAVQTAFKEQIAALK